VVTDQFLNAVEANEDIPLTFRQKTYRTVPARELWNLILSSMISNGEPGLLNGSNLRKNNSYYFAPVIATNPCGEVPLEAYGVCCLGSLVLPSFLAGKSTKWIDMERVIYLAIRFLDQVIDKSVFLIHKNEQAAHRSRRIGLGVMGLAEYLFAKQLKYGSPEAVLEVERVMKFIRDCSYQASTKLAVEKGAFPAFSTKDFVASSFVRRLPARIRMDIKKHGIRNVTCNAVAPTGTISLLADVTSSIEPTFALEYTRHDRVSTRQYRHSILASIKEGETWPEYIVSAMDVAPESHFETQVAVQRYIDGAVSKTINLPNSATVKDLNDLLLEYTHDLKGITVYRDGSRNNQVLESGCVSGKCEV
jgi:ribonucleoside-diphosphate reductase alpha chain